MEKEISGKVKEFPGKPTSVWLDTTSVTKYPSFHDGDEVDVVVVGGGMAGLTTAYLLKEGGFKVAVLELGRIVEDITGYTTAKITSLHGSIYSKLAHKHGEEKARVYGEANQSAAQKIADIIRAEKIDCDFEWQDAYTYTEYEKSLDGLKSEAEVAKKLGLPASYTENTPLKFIKGAVKFTGQAQFHPRKYLLRLAEKIKESPGSGIYEDTRVLQIREEEKAVVETDRGDIRARYVVIATHFPVYDKGIFFTRLHPYSAHVLGMRVKNEFPGGMYYSDDDNVRSLRSVPYHGGRLVLVGGEDHGIDKLDEPSVYFKKLKSYAEDRFEVESILYHWTNQDNSTNDGLPYIGKSPGSHNIYIACGFDGWGMTNSTVAGMLLADMIAGKENPWQKVFEPSRKDILASPGKLFRGGLAFIKNKIEITQKGIVENIEKGEGKIVKIKGEKVAIYKDNKGRVYKMSPICTHMGCTVGFNKEEKTWDCPCHGSRYNFDGTVIHGPARRDLEKKE